MKVRLLTRKGSNQPGATVEYDRVSAQWLIEKGHAEAVEEKAETKAADDDAKPARRGRPPKGDS